MILVNISSPVIRYALKQRSLLFCQP